MYFWRQTLKFFQLKAARQARQQYVVLALCVLPKVHGGACSQFLRPVVQPTYGDVGTKEFLFRIFFESTLRYHTAAVSRMRSKVELYAHQAGS